MLSPSSSLPARTTFVLVTLTCSFVPCRQSELRLELPIRWPRPSGLISTVIVKGATFACFEYSVPDQMPRTSAAAFFEPPGGAVWASAVVAETDMILSKHAAIQIQKGT